MCVCVRVCVRACVFVRATTGGGACKFLLLPLTLTASRFLQGSFFATGAGGVAVLDRWKKRDSLAWVAMVVGMQRPQ
eukprot:m.151637 g.151637  ORF g.151637 m.151637 type:complete len:77 (-) comp17418_c0_seq1:2-232(-)